MTDADEPNPVRDHMVEILTRLEAGEGRAVFASTDLTDPEWLLAWSVVFDTDNGGADELIAAAPAPQYTKLNRKGVRALRTLRANDQAREAANPTDPTRTDPR